MLKALIKPFFRRILSYEREFYIRSLIRRMFVYRDYDSSAYWRKRADDPGQAAVLWTNQEYNQLYRVRQTEIVRKILADLPPGGRVLDIGCGIGIVAAMVVDNHPSAVVDAVDFPEMIRVARQTTVHDRIHYVESPAESYSPTDKRYDLVISSGCISVIRHIPSLEQAIRNVCELTAPGGTVLMIDPFHRWNFLARAKYGSNQVIRLMREMGFRLAHKSGVLFWPYREWLATAAFGGYTMRRRFIDGERLLQMLGPHFWADYKVLQFVRCSHDLPQRGPVLPAAPAAEGVADQITR